MVAVVVSHLILATAGLRQLDQRQDGSEEWTALDIWNNATVGFIYVAFVELILVRYLPKAAFEQKWKNI